MGADGSNPVWLTEGTGTFLVAQRRSDRVRGGRVRSSPVSDLNGTDRGVELLSLIDYRPQRMDMHLNQLACLAIFEQAEVGRRREAGRASSNAPGWMSPRDPGARAHWLRCLDAPPGRGEATGGRFDHGQPESLSYRRKGEDLLALSTPDQLCLRIHVRPEGRIVESRLTGPSRRACHAPDHHPRSPCEASLPGFVARTVHRSGTRCSCDAPVCSRK